METRTKRDEIVELVHKLFVYTDQRSWEKLIDEVFRDRVRFDMSSLNGEMEREMAATDICKMWSNGFEGIDHVHHHAGNIVVHFDDAVDANEARIFCYATATHYKRSARNGNTRDFVGSYDLHASFTDRGWRISYFRYNLKYIVGNEKLE